MGKWRYSSANCNVGNRWRLIRPSPLLACEKDIYPSGKRLGGAAEPSGRCGKENRLRSVRTCNVNTVVPSGNINTSLCTLQPGTVSLEASNVMSICRRQ